MVTYKDLKDYRYIDSAIAMAQRKLDSIGSKPMLTDKVTGSSPEYPYAKRGFMVSGIDEHAINEYQRRYDAAKEEYDRLVRLKSEIELIRNTVSNVRDRLMIEYIIAGKPQKVIASELRISQSSVSERVIVVCERCIAEYADISDISDKVDKMGV